MPNSNAKPGDVVWKTCKLINGFDKELDIIGLLVELDIYEDIYSPSLSGVLTLVDTYNLIGRFPLLGEEKLEIEFFTPESKLVMKQKFRVYKVANRKIEMNKQQYQLFFFSEETAKSHGTLLSLPFSGNGDTIVKQIVSEKLKSSKTVLTDSPSNFLKFVSPYWSPFECINYVTTHSLASTTTKQADFLFFETSREYVFKSLETIKKEKHKELYYYDHSRGIKSKTVEDATIDVDRQMASIIDARYLTIGDWVDRVDKEAYTKLTIVHDLLFKTVDYLHYDIEKHYDQMAHVGGTFKGTSPDESQDKFRDYILPKKEPPTKDEEYNTSVGWSYHSSYDELKTDYSGQAVHTRRSYLALNEFLKFDIDTWGNTNLTVGDCIWINFGKYIIETDKQNLYDPVLTGKYLITSIVHRVAPAQHLMTMRVAKDSIGVDLESYSNEEYQKLSKSATNKNDNAAQGGVVGASSYSSTEADVFK